MQQLVQVRAFEAHPAFDPRALKVYVALAAVLIVGTALFFAQGFHFAVSVGPPAWALVTVLAGILARRIGWARTATGLETIGLTYAQGFAFLLLIYAVVPLSLPMADKTLAAADHALGFNWLSYASIPHGHPNIHTAMRISYRAFGWQPAVALAFVAWTGRTDRCWRFVWATTLTLIATSLIFPLLPAVGALRHYGIQPSYLPLLQPLGGWDFGPIIEAIKTGHRTIDYSMLGGLVSFPSFHAASAVLVVWLAWPTNARWFFLPLGIALVFSTPMVGSHYFVDVIGGIALSIMALRMSSFAAWPTKLHPSAHRSLSS